MKKFIALITIFIFSCPLFAGDIAYIAKQDNKTVYIDITELSSAVFPGTKFKVIDKEEDLKNHKGESLGMMYSYGPSAVVTQVQPKYAVAELSAEYKTKAGQKLQIETAAAAPVIAPAAPATVAPPKKEETALAAGSVSKLLQTAPVDEKIIAASLIVLNGKDVLVAASEKNKIKAYNLEGYELKEILEHSVTPFKQILTLSAADIKGTGTPQVFAAVFEERAQKLSTLVFEFEQGKLKETAQLRWVAKAVHTPAGPALFGQEVYKHNEVKSTPVGKITFTKNKFKYNKLGSRNDSNATAFSFNAGDIDGDGGTDSLFSTNFGKIKLLLSKGKGAEFSEGEFSTAPVRFNMAGQVQRVLLPIQSTVDAGGQTIFAAAENTPKIGIVADSFGAYKGGKVFFIAWSGTGLKEVAEVNVEGVVYDLSHAFYNGTQGILVTQVFDSGNTVFEIYK